MNEKLWVFIQFLINCPGAWGTIQKIDNFEAKSERMLNVRLLWATVEPHKPEYITRNTQAITATLTRYDIPVTLIRSHAKYRLWD